MAAPGEPPTDAADPDPSTTGPRPPVPPSRIPAADPRIPAADALDRYSQTTAQQPGETVPISVDVPKGMVVMAVTPTEATELERSRIQASRGRLFRLIPRDWTTPLALLIPLLAALVTNISDQGVRIGFVAATVLAAIWFTLSVIGRVVDALKARSVQQRPPPVLK